MKGLRVYLGMPLFHKRVTTNTFKFLINKVCNKLNGWGARRLSLVNQITLAKSILLASPNYFMNSIHVPIIVYNEI